MEEAAAIMAAGKGTRLQADLASDLPKVCHCVGGKPLVQWAVEACQAAGIEQIIVIVGYRAEEVQKVLAGWPVKYAVQAEQKGTGHAALQARQVLDDRPTRLFVLNGDMPFVDAETLNKLREAHLDQEAHMTLASTIPPRPLEYGRVIRDSAQRVLRIVEEKDCRTEQERNVRELNLGFYVFNTPEAFEIMETLGSDTAQGEIYITDMAEACAQRDKKVVAVQVPPEVGIGVNNKQQLDEVDATLRARAAKSN